MEVQIYGEKYVDMCWVQKWMVQTVNSSNSVVWEKGGRDAS